MKQYTVKALLVNDNGQEVYQSVTLMSDSEINAKNQAGVYFKNLGYLFISAEIEA